METIPALFFSCFLVVTMANLMEMISKPDFVISSDMKIKIDTSDLAPVIIAPLLAHLFFAYLVFFAYPDFLESVEHETMKNSPPIQIKNDYNPEPKFSLINLMKDAV